MYRIILTLAALLLAPSVFEQTPLVTFSKASTEPPPVPDSLFRWTITPEPEGAAVQLRFDFTIEPGWKLYAMDSSSWPASSSPRPAAGTTLTSMLRSVTSRT